MPAKGRKRDEDEMETGSSREPSPPPKSSSPPASSQNQARASSSGSGSVSASHMGSGTGSGSNNQARTSTSPPSSSSIKTPSPPSQSALARTSGSSARRTSRLTCFPLSCLRAYPGVRAHARSYRTQVTDSARCARVRVPALYSVLQGAHASLRGHPPRQPRRMGAACPEPGSERVPSP